MYAQIPGTLRTDEGTRYVLNHLEIQFCLQDLTIISSNEQPGLVDCVYKIEAG